MCNSARLRQLRLASALTLTNSAPIRYSRDKIAASSRACFILSHNAPPGRTHKQDRLHRVALRDVRQATTSACEPFALALEFAAPQLLASSTTSSSLRAASSSIMRSSMPPSSSSHALSALIDGTATPALATASQSVARTMSSLSLSSLHASSSSIAAATLPALMFGSECAQCTSLVLAWPTTAQRDAFLSALLVRIGCQLCVCMCVCVCVFTAKTQVERSKMSSHAASSAARVARAS